MTETNYLNELNKETQKDNALLLSIIIPSPWMHDDSFNKEDVITKVNDRTQIIQSYYKRRGYAQWSDALSELMMNDDISKGLVNLVLLIGRRMKFGSNKVILDINADYVKSIIKKDDTFRKHIKTLEVYNVIRKTTKPHIYVVNHNMLFKGDYTKFINAYSRLYKKKGISIDAKCRVVLDKNVNYGK